MRATFENIFTAGGDVTVAQAPGRVNLIGEHTDYNEGFVLPMPIDRTVRVALRPRDDGKIIAHSLDLNRRTRLELERRGSEPTGFGKFVGGALRELHARGLVDRGAEVLIAGDLPRGAGLSSSAALCAALVTAAGGAFGFELAPLDAALLCRDVEHRHAGVRCGIMDPLVVLAGRPGNALLIDCRSNAFRQIALPFDDHRVVVVDSGVRRGLASSAYNDRRRECEAALARLQSIEPAPGTPRSLRDVTPEQLDAYAAGLADIEGRRARHVVTENARVLEAAACLESGDPDGLALLGGLMTASHASLRDDYEVSHPALDRLVDAAMSVDGVVGARMTGAGFGGCTVQIVRREALGTFVRVMETALGELGERAGRGAVFPVEAREESGVVPDAKA